MQHDPHFARHAELIAAGSAEPVGEPAAEPLSRFDRACIAVAIAGLATTYGRALVDLAWSAL